MENKKSEYFQTIARYLFSRRGAPFYLSSQEIDLIAAWEKQGIPLDVVLNGMRQRFDKPGREPGGKGRRTLFSCRISVQRAFEQSRERRIGRRGTGPREPQAKLEAVRSEVENFLSRIPPELGGLKDIYESLSENLRLREPSEDELERADRAVEAWLSAHASSEDRTLAEQTAAADLTAWGEHEQQRLHDIRLARFLRHKYRIPFLSPFYY